MSQCIVNINTQKIFVKIYGISEATYSQWKNGTNQMSVSTLYKICKTLKIPADYLLCLMDVDIINKVNKLNMLNQEYDYKIKEVLYEKI